MRVAVTGATSGVGMRLCEVLRERGAEVVALVREPARGDARQLASLGVTLVKGDLEDEGALGELCRGASVIHHCAAQVGDWGAAEAFVAVNVAGTRRVVEAAAAGGVRRFVHLSSTAVYGRPDHGRVTEEWPVRRSGKPYDDTKVDAELLAFALGAQLGLEVAAIRPPVIYGPYDRNFMPRAVKMLRAGRFLLIAGGRAPLNLVWVDHVVDVMIAASERAEAVGQAFNVMDEVDGRPPSVREVATTIAEACEAPPPSRSVPFALALGVSHVVEKVFVLRGAKEPPPVTPWSVVILTRDVVYDASKAARLLGFAPKRGSLEGLRLEAQAFRKRELAAALGV